MQQFGGLLCGPPQLACLQALAVRPEQLKQQLVQSMECCCRMSVGYAGKGNAKAKVVIDLRLACCANMQCHRATMPSTEVGCNLRIPSRDDRTITTRMAIPSG
eukprot:4230999-Amphidinium_carterae.1